MRKLNLALFLLGCILVTSFIPAYADNDLAFANKASESIFKEDNSLLKPKRRPVKRGGRRGKNKLQTIQFGVDVGANMSMLPIADFTNKMSFGFNLGGYVDYNLNNNIFFEGGLYLMNKNLANELSISQSIPGVMSMEMISSSKMNIMTLTIPIQFGVNLVSSDNFKFNFKVGPYLGLGLTGTQKIAVISKITYNQPGAPTVPPTTIEREGDAFETIDRLDFGVRAGLGFDISKINIGLFVDYGLIKYEMASSFKTVSTGSTSTTTTDSYKGNIISIGINLGYKF